MSTLVATGAMPNFFIIGAAKAGTTSLHWYLDQHPEVAMSTDKEPNYFSGPANGIPYPLGRVEDRADYERLFDPGARVRGEASVGYANAPRRLGVPARIKAAVPEAKFVYLVRDPVDRTVSHYRHRVASEGERRPIDEALADLEDECSVYLCPSLYGTQLELYLAEFPAERVLVLDQRDLLARRGETLARVFGFLGVDPAFTTDAWDLELYKAEERRVHPPAWEKAMARLERPLRRVPKGARRAARRSVERVLWRPAPKVELEAGLRARLQERLAPEAARLRELTEEPFAGWSV